MGRLILISLTILLSLQLTAQINNSKKPIMETISPNIFVRDIAQTIEFYKMLGFQVHITVPDDKNPEFALMESGTATIMFQTFKSLGDTLPIISRTDGGSLLLYIKMKRIRDFYDKLKGKVQIIQDLNRTFYGATEFSIKDNNNYMLTFAEDE